MVLEGANCEVKKKNDPYKTKKRIIGKHFYGATSEVYYSNKNINLKIDLQLTEKSVKKEDKHPFS